MPHLTVMTTPPPKTQAARPEGLEPPTLGSEDNSPPSLTYFQGNDLRQVENAVVPSVVPWPKIGWPCQIPDAQRAPSPSPKSVCSSLSWRFGQTLTLVLRRTTRSVNSVMGVTGVVNSLTSPAVQPVRSV